MKMFIIYNLKTEYEEILYILFCVNLATLVFSSASISKTSITYETSSHLVNKCNSECFNNKS